MWQYIANKSLIYKLKKNNWHIIEVERVYRVGYIMYFLDNFASIQIQKPVVIKTNEFKRCIIIIKTFLKMADC